MHSALRRYTEISGLSHSFCAIHETILKLKFKDFYIVITKLYILLISIIMSNYTYKLFRLLKFIVIQEILVPIISRINERRNDYFTR